MSALSATTFSPQSSSSSRRSLSQRPAEHAMSSMHHEYFSVDVGAHNHASVVVKLRPKETLDNTGAQTGCAAQSSHGEKLVYCCSFWKGFLSDGSIPARRPRVEVVKALQPARQVFCGVFTETRSVNSSTLSVVSLVLLEDPKQFVVYICTNLVGVSVVFVGEGKNGPRNTSCYDLVDAQGIQDTSIWSGNGGFQEFHMSSVKRSSTL